MAARHYKMSNPKEIFRHPSKHNSDEYMDSRDIAISVITIVKNNETLLPRAIDSVLAQTFADYEYIIVDDGSTDGTEAVINSYAETDKRVNPIHLAQNIGRAMARNTGLDAATGRYVFFLDSDDYLPENALIDLYEVAEKYHSDVVYGGIKCFDGKTGEWLDSHYTDKIIDCDHHNLRLEDHLALVDNHQIIGRLYQRKFLKNNHITFSKIRKNGEDVLFAFYTAFSANNISMLASKKVYFYNTGNYIETANESKLYDARDNVLETIRTAQEKGSPALQRMMWRKGAMYSGNLARAEKIFADREDKFLAYLASLAPLVEGVDEDVLTSMWPYYRDISRALASHNLEEALTIWKWSQATESNVWELEAKLEYLRTETRTLTQQLDDLYSSTSWRITAPLRTAMGILKVASPRRRITTQSGQPGLNPEVKDSLPGRRNVTQLEQPGLSPKVSVIIPIYKVEKYLVQCLDSVVSQTLNDIEIVCINDCSPDGSQSILDEYSAKDVRFVLLQHEINRGLAGARNTGLDTATGEYIYFLDSDDFLASNDALEILFRAAREDDADEVIGGIIKWHEDTDEKYLDWHKNYLEKEVHGQSLDSLPQLRANVIAPNKLIRKTLLEKYHIRFNEELRKHEDNPFSCKVHVLANRISIIPVTTYIYRQDRSGSIMSNEKKEDAYFRSIYCADIFTFIESEEAHRQYRSMYYPGYSWQLVKGAEILSRFSPSLKQKLELMSRWSNAIEPMPPGFPEVPDHLREIFLLVRQGKPEEAWRKAVILIESSEGLLPSQPAPSEFVSGLKQRIQKLKPAIEQQQKINFRISSQIESVLTSKSWRITAGLRSLTSMVRGM